MATNKTILNVETDETILDIATVVDLSFMIRNDKNGFGFWFTDSEDAEKVREEILNAYPDAKGEIVYPAESTPPEKSQLMEFLEEKEDADI